jgi:transcriptional regulator with XRE-family HTH domain
MQNKPSIQGLARGQVQTSLSIGARIRQLREQRGLTQGDVEQKTGLMRCYISRVENGFKVPSLDTLEKFAAAFDLPLYRLFYIDSEPLSTGHAFRPSALRLLRIGREKGPRARFLRKLGNLWGHMGGPEQELLLDVASRLAARTGQTANQRCSPAQASVKFNVMSMRLVPTRGVRGRKGSQFVDADSRQLSTRDPKVFRYSTLDRS